MVYRGVTILYCHQAGNVNFPIQGKLFTGDSFSGNTRPWIFQKCG